MSARTPVRRPAHSPCLAGRGVCTGPRGDGWLSPASPLSPALRKPGSLVCEVLLADGVGGVGPPSRPARSACVPGLGWAARGSPRAPCPSRDERPLGSECRTVTPPSARLGSTLQRVRPPRGTDPRPRGRGRCGMVGPTPSTSRGPAAERAAVLTGASAPPKARPPHQPKMLPWGTPCSPLSSPVVIEKPHHLPPL